jgi:aldose 1-epimerase
MYPMAPWAGRLRHNQVTAVTAEQNGISQDADFHPPINFMEWAIHGTVLDRPLEDWELGDAEFRGSQVITGTPWQGQVTYMWRLSGRTLITDMEIIAESVMPAVIGWHPYFAKSLWGGTARWTAPEAQIAPRVGAFADGSLRPWQAQSAAVDDAFWVPGREVTVHWGEQAQLRVMNSHPWFVIFDELTDALCVEPQTAAPNALDTPIKESAPVARAGAPVRMTTTWEWSIR